MKAIRVRAIAGQASDGAQVGHGLQRLHALEREIINQQQQVVETRRHAARVAAVAAAPSARPAAAQDAARHAREAARASDADAKSLQRKTQQLQVRSSAGQAATHASHA
jgi:hypothetical protein